MRGAVEGLSNALSQLGESSNSDRLMEAVRGPLESLRLRSTELGFGEVRQAASGLRRYLDIQSGSPVSVDSMMVFNFALGTLLEAMGNGDLGSRAAAFRADEVLGILELPPEPAGAAEPGPTLAAAVSSDPSAAASPVLDFSRLSHVVGQLGGTLEIKAEAGAEARFTLSFAATTANLNQVETLFFPLDAELGIAPQLAEQDDRNREMLNKIKDFMQAMASADLGRGQEILAEIAEQKHQAGLYQEIGSMARGLHNSLKEFAQNLDPALKDMVQEKLPDSGSRLEHIMKLTENAANITLDNVEKMQRDNQNDHQRLARLEQLVGQLKAIGDPAQQRLTDGTGLIEELRASAQKTHDRLITVLTAQDYQDLTGQVILKIIKLLNELEGKLVRVISTFGVKVEGKAEPTLKDELYGPAHEGMANALNSQVDVDSLLAEFGF